MISMNILVMNDSVLVEEEPVRNGIKNIELRDLSKLGGYEKVPNGELLLQRQMSEKSSLSSDSGSSDDPKIIDVDFMQMKKRVGLLSGVALIVGTMIGTEFFFDFPPECLL